MRTTSLITVAVLHCTRSSSPATSKMRSYRRPSTIGRETTIPACAAACAMASSAMPPFSVGDSVLTGAGAESPASAARQELGHVQVVGRLGRGGGPAPSPAAAAAGGARARRRRIVPRRLGAGLRLLLVARAEARLRGAGRCRLVQVCREPRVREVDVAQQVLGVLAQRR